MHQPAIVDDADEAYEIMKSIRLRPSADGPSSRRHVLDRGMQVRVLEAVAATAVH